MEARPGDIAGLLRGLSGQARRERADLVAWLLDRGFEFQQIDGALVPVLLPANRVIGDDGAQTTIRQICEATGFEEGLLRRLHRVIGLPAVDSTVDATLSRADAESVLRTRAFVDLGFDADEVVAIVRVLVQGLGRAAEAMRKAALKAVLTPGATEVGLAKAFEGLANHLAPALGPMITDLLYLELRRSFETEAVSYAERASGSLPGARQITVGFADLVGFTELGETVAPEQLERTASRLAELAHDAVEAPVRYVKSIGDAVMFVSSDAGALLMAVLDLMSVVAQQHLPRLRAGIASGWAVSHAGDWYGHPVNLASRITDAARPGAVVVADSVRRQLAARTDLDWSPLGEYALKGVSGKESLTSVGRRSAGS